MEANGSFSIVLTHWPRLYAAWPAGLTVITAIELIGLLINPFNGLGSAQKRLGTDLFRPRCFLVSSLHRF